MSHDLRRKERRETDTAVELIWKTETREQRIESCRAINLSETGVAVECPEPIPLLVHVIARVPAFEIAALAQVKRCSLTRSSYTLGLHFIARASIGPPDPMAPDHYEILRLSPTCDQETIERVYRTLMKRFHPDNEKTGDAEIFLRIAEAHRILSDPMKRQRYDAQREESHAVVRFDLRSREFFAGLRGEQNRRLATLCLLYRKRTSDLDSPGLSILELERLSGFTREELGFALWYLSQKGLARPDDRTHYGITAEGVDHVETKIGDDQADLRLIASLQIPGQPDVGRAPIGV